MKKIFFFLFSFFFFLFSFFFFLCMCVCVLIRVRAKTKWRVVESKVVFNAVHRRPAVSAVATDAAADRFPNIVCECIVEDLRRAIDFASSAAANAIGIFGCGHCRFAKRGRRNFDNLLCLFLFFGVGQHNPVRRV